MTTTRQQRTASVTLTEDHAVELYHMLKNRGASTLRDMLVEALEALDPYLARPLATAECTDGHLDTGRGVCADCGKPLDTWD